LVTLPNGETVNTVSWSLTDGANSYSGTATLSASNTFNVDGVAAGSNYVLSVTAQTTDGTEQCSGASAPFSVADGQISYETINGTCVATTSADAGTVVGQVNFGQATCAAVDPLLAPIAAHANGADVPVFGHVDLPAGEAFTYTWSVGGGSLSATDGGALVLTVSGSGTGPTDLEVFFWALPESPLVTLTITYAGSASCPTAATVQTIVPTVN
jgi:hypothetical protein